MTKPGNRFYPVTTPSFLAPPLGQPNMPGLVIEDYRWWVDNEREILNWMVERLPRGIDHQEGMMIIFDSDEDRMLFLLRWS